MLRFLVLLLTLSANTAFAQPFIREAIGASSFERTPLATIFGGLAGPSCTSAPDSGTCDSCAVEPTCVTAPLCICNTKKIKDGGVLTLALNPKTRVGEARLARGQSTYDLVSTLKENDGHQIDFNWSVICQNSALTSCVGVEKNAYLVGRIFIDRNKNGVMDDSQRATPVRFQLIKPSDDYSVAGGVFNEGVLGFVPYPGDQRIFLADLKVSQAFPALSYGATARKVRVFISTKSLSQANPRQADRTEDFKLQPDGSLETNAIEGLVNGQTYFLRLAVVDEAENVVLFFPAGEGNVNCETQPGTGCPWAATPEVVRGQRH